MKVITAKTAGFCFGVERAVDTVYNQLEKETDKPIYTYGPIIHNKEVIKDMEKKGIKLLHTEKELETLTQGTVIIRSHGVSKHIYEILEKKEIKFVDATCPYVKKIHSIVQKESEEGKYILIIGNPIHPEIEGILGWIKGPKGVVHTKEEAEKFSFSEEMPICIVAQTTFNYDKFKDLVEILSKKEYDIIVLNTICSATRKRQEEANEIAKKVDAMIVVGDKQSSNTQKLFEICSKACNDTYYIQTLADLDLKQLGSVESVGITAGASTPKNIIEEVQINV